MSHQRAETPHYCRLQLRWLVPKCCWSRRRSKSGAVSGLCNHTSPSRGSQERKHHWELQQREGFELKKASKLSRWWNFLYKMHKINIGFLKHMLNTNTHTADMVMRCAAASAHQTAIFISSEHNAPDVIHHNWRLSGSHITESQLWALESV